MSGIVNYLEERGVTVRYARGGWQPCKCPYHEDRSASCSVDTGKGRFHCFVCDINEDLVGLIRRDTGMTYVEAKQEAETKYGESPIPLDRLPSRGGALPDAPWNNNRNGKSLQSWRSSFV